MKQICDKNIEIEYNFVQFKTKSFQEIIELKKRTDIYIDQYNNIGGFGTSSIEAITYGCITLCTINKLNNLLFNIIDKKEFPIIDISGDNNNLHNIIEKYCNLCKDEILNITKKNINWIKNNLSSKKICEIMEKNIDNIITK